MCTAHHYWQGHIGQDGEHRDHIEYPLFPSSERIWCSLVSIMNSSFEAEGGINFRFLEHKLYESRIAKRFNGKRYQTMYLLEQYSVFGGLKGRVSMLQ